MYFDNLGVVINAGNIIEEDHYYAFGLKIAAISSRKLGDVNEGKLSNPYGYNDKEMLDEDAGLGWVDYGFREYAPQIGRFIQLVPMAWGYQELTPYQFASNDPIANVDLDGLEAFSSIKSGANTLITTSEAASRTLVGAGSAAHWVTTLNDAAVV